jgi:hypothetical protein
MSTMLYEHWKKSSRNTGRAGRVFGVAPDGESYVLAEAVQPRLESKRWRCQTVDRICRFADERAAESRTSHDWLTHKFTSAPTTGSTR